MPFRVKILVLIISRWMWGVPPSRTFWNFWGGMSPSLFWEGVPPPFVGGGPPPKKINGGNDFCNLFLSYPGGGGSAPHTPRRLWFGYVRTSSKNWFLTKSGSICTVLRSLDPQNWGLVASNRPATASLRISVKFPPWGVVLIEIQPILTHIIAVQRFLGRVPPPNAKKFGWGVPGDKPK